MFILRNRPGQQPQLVQTIQQNPQIVQIQPQQNQQSQPVQMQQVTVQQAQAQPQQRKGLTLSVIKVFLTFNRGAKILAMIYFAVKLMTFSSVYIQVANF